MFDLLKNLYIKIESIRGKKLVITLVVIFVVFSLIGLVFGYFIQISLNENELDNAIPVRATPTPPEKISFKGKVEYVNPDVYGVSYVLVDEEGNDVLLLKSDDEKLALSEGLFVTVTGIKVPKAENQKLDLLLVEEIAISNK